MAKFKITPTTTVAELKEQFSKEIGGVLRIYEGLSEAADGVTLVSLGAKEGELECRTSRTVGKFEEAFQNDLNLRVNVYTKGNWVRVLDGITLATAAELPNRMTKAKMEEYLAYQKEGKEEENAEIKDTPEAENKEVPKGDYPKSEEDVVKYPAGTNPCNKVEVVGLATTEKTESGLPFLKIVVEQIYFRKQYFEIAYDYLESESYFGTCIVMNSLSANQAKYPLDKIGYMGISGYAAEGLMDFHSEDEFACNSMLYGGYFMVAHPEEEDEWYQYDYEIKDNTASALALILHPESGFTIENHPYEGPEAIVELNIVDVDNEDIHHTYRYHILEKDGKWVAEKLD